jgi:hypothetical protein
MSGPQNDTIFRNFQFVDIWKLNKLLEKCQLFNVL